MSLAADIYHKTILDRARRPRHQRRLEPFDAEAREVSPFCGDRITLRLRNSDGGAAVEAIGYEARGCAICLASADFMAELLPGMTRAGALDLGATFARALRRGEPRDGHGLPGSLHLFLPLQDAPSRIGCALLPWHALAQALATGGNGDG